MNDRVLVEALRARDPGALSTLYDTFAEGLHRYCRSMLTDIDGAQVALRDTLIVAEAHIHALADADRLKVWLYTLARGSAYGGAWPSAPARRPRRPSPRPPGAAAPTSG
nr:hypothetical protein GCM10020093_072560 [Planobispora longispora]